MVNNKIEDSRGHIYLLCGALSYPNDFFLSLSYVTVESKESGDTVRSLAYLEFGVGYGIAALLIGDKVTELDDLRLETQGDLFDVRGQMWSDDFWPKRTQKMWSDLREIMWPFQKS